MVQVDLACSVIRDTAQLQLGQTLVTLPIVQTNQPTTPTHLQRREVGQVIQAGQARGVIRDTQQLQLGYPAHAHRVHRQQRKRLTLAPLGQ